ncbi:MAG: sulfatase-like hydrolase/transferase, partial [Bacteroidales bacterium]|nr:sulfatase-like hydrolase/transferase [Bacteroidales bacterium]
MTFFSKGMTVLSKPKVIIGILMHDSGRQLGCYGAPDAITPNMDRMAKEGVRFQHHYSTGTVCIPSRTSVLTGNCLHNASICFYDHTVTTLPRVLKTAGYKTLRCGFAEEKEYRPIAGGPYPHGDFNVSGTSLLGYDQSITDSSQAADVVENIKNALKEQNGPIYIAAAFTEAHSPYDLPVTEDDIDAAVLPPKLPQLPDTRPAREMLARFNKAVTAADSAIGAIMGFIEDNGLYEDTLMYVSSDHGIDFPRAKQSCY